MACSVSRRASQVCLSNYRAAESFGSPKRDNLHYPNIGYAITDCQRTLAPVQRLFSMFPQGWPGAGLIFLRVSVATGLLIDAHTHHAVMGGWIQGLAIVVSIPLFAGYFTPVVAALALLLHGLIWLRAGIGTFDIVVIESLDIVALAFLGPGGYSADALQFGRRLILPTR
jgi:hypothetical protein